MTANLRLIQQGICDGNEMALTELYRLFHSRLHYFSTSIVKSPEDAEELVEDVFVKLWANRKEILRIDNLSVYLYVAVKNRCYNLLVKRGKTVYYSFEDMGDEMSTPSLDPHRLLVSAEMMRRMQLAIEALPPRCKMIFRLIREDGLQYKEVAQILGISVNTIDVQMAIATKRICALLEQQDGDVKLSPRSNSPDRKN
ncbi:MAG: RNA polymerase sigma-70 factor [Chitinophagaceae bacterium]